MLSYIHAYHAGNHADILKHLTISLILEHLAQKEKPFTVIDTHAGSGIYSLHDARAQKTGDASSGVEKIIRNEKLAISNFSDCKFFQIVSEFYENGEYPGSPLVENAFLRNGDEQILSELHPLAFEELKSCFSEKEFGFTGKVRPQIHKRDGYELLKAVTPPKIRRGLVVIDPSFEDSEDFEKCAESVSLVHKKWNSGIVALWYPLIERRSAEISLMKERISSSVYLKDSPEAKILDIQMEVRKREDMTGLASLYGSGMFIVNFPYQLDEKMREILPALSEILGETAKAWSVELR